MTPQLQAAINQANTKRPRAPIDLRARLYKTACASSVSLATMTIKMKEQWDLIDAARARADINRRVMEGHHAVSPEALDSDT